MNNFAVANTVAEVFHAVFDFVGCGSYCKIGVAIFASQTILSQSSICADILEIAIKGLMVV